MSLVPREKEMTEKQQRTLLAEDLSGQKHQRPLENFSFRISAYGILKQGDTVLFQRRKGFELFGFPGGGIEIGETVSAALVREFREETGLDIEVGEIAGYDEHFFTHEGNDFQSILLFFWVNHKGGTLTPNGDGVENDQVKFFDVRSIDSEIIHPLSRPLLQRLRSRGAYEGE